MKTFYYRIRNIGRWVKSTGWKAAWLWACYRMMTRLGFQPPVDLSVKPRRAMHPLRMRLGSSSDLDVFKQIFEFEEYSGLRSLKSPRCILDLGANVGYSSAYFLSCYPAATVIAVEPDPRNIEFCRRNLAPYGDRAVVLFGAVWSKRCKLMLSEETGADDREWATQVREAMAGDREGTVEGWDIPSLMAMAGVKEIDLLKVDIERSEIELFNASSSVWLPAVKNICIELHGPECQEVFHRALGEYEYQATSCGELTICQGLKKKSPFGTSTK